MSRIVLSTDHLHDHSGEDDDRFGGWDYSRDTSDPTYERWHGGGTPHSLLWRRQRPRAACLGQER
jgi:hypothetical protein